LSTSIVAEATTEVRREWQHQGQRKHHRTKALIRAAIKHIHEGKSVSDAPHDPLTQDQHTSLAINDNKAQIHPPRRP